MGHPVVNIERIDENRIKIHQGQFLFDPSSKPIKKSPFK